MTIFKTREGLSRAALALEADLTNLGAEGLHGVINETLSIINNISVGHLAAILEDRAPAYKVDKAQDSISDNTRVALIGIMAFAACVSGLNMRPDHPARQMYFSAIMSIASGTLDLCKLLEYISKEAPDENA